jgi:hypothetical protein
LQLLVYLKPVLTAGRDSDLPMTAPVLYRAVA